MPDHNRGATSADSSLAPQLVRGAVGFGLIGAALALTPSVGPVALLLMLPGMVALRGCPMCWIAGLIQIVSAGRLARTCTNNQCVLAASASTNAHHQGPMQ